MALSELLASFLQPLFDLLPRVDHRPAVNEWAVADAWLREPRTFKGPIFRIPAITHIEYYSAAEVCLDVGIQSLTTIERKSVAVNATAIVLIEDPLLLRLHTDAHDWEQWVSMRVRAIVTEIITGHSWDYSLEHASSFICRHASQELREYGVDVIQVVLEDATEVMPVRLFNNHGE